MTTVQANVRFTPDDLLRLEEEGQFELIDGKLSEKKMSLLANLTAGRVLVALSNFASRTGIGFAVPEQSFQCFPDYPDRIRRPDVAFILAGRMPTDLSQGHALIAPDIAVEVVSPTDLIYDLDAKLADYRAAGVKLVWVINPIARTLRIHRIDRTVSELKDTDTLRGDSVLPDFAIPLSELLPPPSTAPRR